MDTVRNPGDSGKCYYSARDQHGRIAVNLLKLRSKWIGLALPFLAFLLAFTPHAFALSNDSAANIVIGQPDLTTFSPGATVAGLVGPYDVAFDHSGNLWVADAGGSRVLEYKQPFSNDESASTVIGQTSFNSMIPANESATSLTAPQAVAFDSSGNLWVADTSNDRVLEFMAPLSTGEAASVVLGQTSFTNNFDSVTNATSLNSPYGLAFDSSGNLWVADLINGRVVEYTSPFTTGEPATLVIGEPNLNASNDEVSKKGLNAPNAVAFDSAGDLWVVDGHRVLEYAAPLATYEAASLVIGENDFTNSSTAATANVMNGPDGIAFDPSGNLWISDHLNNRVLEFNKPFTTFESASLVLGQPNFTAQGQSYPISPTPTGLDQPGGLAFDSSGNLWVADYVDDRVLGYGADLAAAATSSSATSSHTTSTTSAASSTGATSATSATSTPTTSASTASSAASSSSSTSGGGGVPVFPYQFAVAAVFTVVLAASYLLIRRRTIAGVGTRGPQNV
ncbi:MAG: NHL repeat-containing protein [Thaumarchaeota archaeon]|nr:NHL repeat-containing protein [Nitrososphaerota archaeon]